MNMGTYRVNPRIHSECGEIRTRPTANVDVKFFTRFASNVQEKEKLKQKSFVEQPLLLVEIKKQPQRLLLKADLKKIPANVVIFAGLGQQFNLKGFNRKHF